MSQYKYDQRSDVLLRLDEHTGRWEAVENAPGAIAPVEEEHPLQAAVDPTRIAVAHNAAPVVPGIIAGQYQDRANAYVTAVKPLSFVMGALSVLVAVAAFNVPLLSVTALLYFGTVFAGVWLAGWLATILINAEGALFVHVVLSWVYLFLKGGRK